MRKIFFMLSAFVMLLLFAGCGGNASQEQEAGSKLVYASHDYTRINPAIDEHGEINLLLFNGLTMHDGKGQVVPGLAEKWSYDEGTNTYIFNLRENVKWHDGKPFTAKDVKFTIEAIMDEENESENAPNFEDVKEIKVVDDHTVAFVLKHWPL